MIKIKEQYLTNRKGKQIGVLLEIRQYRRLLAQVEELDAIRVYDEAKSSKEKPIPFETAVEEIERSRR